MSNLDIVVATFNFMDAVENEYKLSRKKFPPFKSGHEAYAVLLEEVEELWEEIKHPTDFSHFEKEAIQVASMCLAMAIELRGGASEYVSRNSSR